MTQQNATKITLHIKNVFIILIFIYILMLNYVRDFTTLCKFSNFSLCKIMGDEDMRRELEEGRERWLKMEKRERERERCVLFEWMMDGSESWRQECACHVRDIERERERGERIMMVLFIWCLIEDVVWEGPLWCQEFQDTNDEADDDVLDVDVGYSLSSLLPCDLLSPLPLPSPYSTDAHY